jgi:kumamolisin
MADARVEIPGSTVSRGATARGLRPADPCQMVEATIVIRRPAAPADGFSGKTRDEIEKSLSAPAGDIAAVADFARQFGLTVKEVSPEKRIVRVEGSVPQMDGAFGIELGYFGGPDSSFLSYDGALTAPSQVAGKIAAVLGLDQAPVAKTREQT